MHHDDKGHDALQQYVGFKGLTLAETRVHLSPVWEYSGAVYDRCLPPGSPPPRHTHILPPASSQSSPGQVNNTLFSTGVFEGLFISFIVPGGLIQWYNNYCIPLSSG